MELAQLQAVCTAKQQGRDAAWSRRHADQQALRQARTGALAPLLDEMETQAQPAARDDGPAGPPGSSRLLNRVMMREAVIVNRDDSLRHGYSLWGGVG